MNIDERIEALTQSVELLASIHADNEKRHADNEKRLARMESALAAGLKAFIEEWTRNGGQQP
jgi:hypothetical protein